MPRTSTIRLSVVIPTKDRPDMLKRCLDSLACQHPRVNEVVIVDSSTTDKTKLLMKNYAKKLTIKYLFLKKLGYPLAYNTGINNTKNRHIAFLGDDCIVSRNWSKKILFYINKYPDAVIQGGVVNLPNDNIYAVIMGNHYKNFVKSHIFKKSYFDCIDSKSSVFPKKYFYQKGKFIGFDERLVYGSEDIEFGQRLIQKGITIRYLPSILISHVERTNFQQFIKQHLRIAKAEGMLTRITRYGRVSLFPGKKTLGNIKTFFELEKEAIQDIRLVDIIRIPILYFLLFIIRIYGYSVWPKISKSA